ncbi:acyl-CoA dehydrogenase family protein [Catellatospora sp. NPDC049133]|uniref:acyl-CoA dehydrogenase family protein n=1 Tax=Catellatospora sp. NPDC049133 TaxID=3155499 RepID=UPI0033DD6087
MSELDRRLLLLQAEARQWADEMRPHALRVDRDPDAISTLTHLAVLSRLGTLQIPAEYNPRPLLLSGERFYLTSALERVVFLEETAYGDLGITLASPGAPMSGVVVDAMGDPAQKESFFGRLLDRPTWTFFALTEPDRGSDAGHLQCRLERPADGGPARLHGDKRYVGNAARADLGVVFARIGGGPLGLGAVLVEAGTPGYSAEPIPTLGVRGAQLAALRLTGVAVPDEQVLGRHLPATRRGALGWLRTFNLLRPVVATMGVGVARAAYEYVLAQRPTARGDAGDRLARMAHDIETVRRLTRRSAEAVDRDADDGHLASVAKVSAARLAERVTVAALQMLGPGARFEHPLLDKLARDARAVEYMEGTSTIQRLGVFKDLLRRGVPPAGAAARSSDQG